MSKPYTLDMLGAYVTELERRPSWELRAMIKALSFHEWLNTADDNARRAAAIAVIAKRATEARKRSHKGAPKRG